MFTMKTFWEDDRSNKTLKGRLVALNKKYPQTGKIDEYRPIVVLSSVVKFLEGLLVDDLRYWCSRNLKKQFGFMQGLSIENCKISLLQKTIEIKKKEKELYYLFIDFKAAYDRIDRKVIIHQIEKHRILTIEKRQLL